jgi:hypothetical protein
MPLKDLEARLAIIFFSSIPFTVDLGILLDKEVNRTLCV